MEKVIKSIRLLLFFALIQLALCSCIFWSGTSLVLKQSCFYFLLALLGLSGSCAFILPSFFFLFGVDLVTFLPLKKWKRLQKNASSKEVRFSIIIISILIFLRNPITILSIAFYIGLGALFLSFLFPKNLRQEVSFYSHLIRDILFVVCTFLLW